MQTLKHVTMTLEFVKSKGVEVRLHRRAKNEATHYCGQCEVSIHHIKFIYLYLFQNLIVKKMSPAPNFPSVPNNQKSQYFNLARRTFIFFQLEVFNVLFVREQENRHIVHCVSCARRQTSSLQGFVCLEEYRLSELTQVYDSFILHKPPALPATLPPPSPIQQKDTPPPSAQKETPSPTPHTQGPTATAAT